MFINPIVHGVKQHVQVTGVGWGGGGYVKYTRYILNYLFLIEKKFGLVISTINRIISCVSGPP